MKKRLEKKIRKFNVAYYMASVLQSVAFEWTGFEVDPDHSDDLLRALVKGNFDKVREIVNHYATTYTTDEVVKGETRHYDMAIPPKNLVNAFAKYVYEVNTEKGVKYIMYTSNTPLRVYEKRYHNRFTDMLEHVEYDYDD